jgi:hypothetical protein
MHFNIITNTFQLSLTFYKKLPLQLLPIMIVVVGSDSLAFCTWVPVHTSVYTPDQIQHVMYVIYTYALDLLHRPAIIFWLGEIVFHTISYCINIIPYSFKMLYFIEYMSLINLLRLVHTIWFVMVNEYFIM